MCKGFEAPFAGLASVLELLPMKKLLFVCMGNICRSPTGEGIMQSVVEKANLSDKIFCDSAGTIGYHTGELRIDELLTFLRERYGLYIDRLPRGDGFQAPSIADRRALRENLEAFTSRLREVGFYQDLSDAYVTQTVTPRYRIDFDGAVPGASAEGGQA